MRRCRRGWRLTPPWLPCCWPGVLAEGPASHALRRGRMLSWRQTRLTSPPPQRCSLWAAVAGLRTSHLWSSHLLLQAQDSSEQELAPPLPVPEAMGACARCWLRAEARRQQGTRPRATPLQPGGRPAPVPLVPSGGPYASPPPCGQVAAMHRMAAGQQAAHSSRRQRCAGLLWGAIAPRLVLFPHKPWRYGGASSTSTSCSTMRALPLARVGKGRSTVLAALPTSPPQASLR